MPVQRQTALLVSYRLLPMIFISLVMLQLDRINVGFAALEMNKAIGIGAEAFGIGAGIFFIGYAIFEIPSNLILQKVGAPRWIGRIIATWGLMSCAMALVSGPISFYIYRFMLGAAEAGFLPGIVYYLGSWYTNEQRASGLGILFTASAAAGTLGGPIACRIAADPRVCHQRLAVDLHHRRRRHRADWDRFRLADAANSSRSRLVAPCQSGMAGTGDRR